MTFIPQTGTAVIRIPKTGSSALETVINAKYGAKTCLCQGHKTASEMVNELVAQNCLHTLREFVVVIRSPMDRFVSALHHLHGRKAGHNLDRAMNDALDPPEHHKVLFKPQYEYLNFLGFAPYKIFGYSTDGVGGLASYLDCEEPQDENVSVKRPDFARR